MKSRTSFSELTPFRKNLTRFAPIWALYAIVLMLTLFAFGSSYNNSFAKWFIGGSLPVFGWINLFYAGICAMALFGDLFNTRMCYSLHALPQRRETWFLSHVSAGLLFSLVPNLLAALYMMTMVLGEYWFLALYWLLGVTLEFVFFFGIGVLSAMLTGSRRGMVTVYALLNFISMLVYLTLRTLYVAQLDGVVLNAAAFTRFSPATHLSALEFFTFTTQRVGGGSGMPYQTLYIYEGLSSGWGYLVCVGVVGLLALGGALLLYRKRHLESAGDFVAFPKLKLALSGVLTLTCAFIFAMLGLLFTAEGYILWMGVGMAIGHFCGLMLLERRLKVFRKKTVLAYVILFAVVVLSFVAVEFDWFGIERWMPDANRVQSVTITNQRSDDAYPYNYYGNTVTMTLTEQTDVERIIAAHQDILNRKDSHEGSKHSVTIQYTMKSGAVVTRSYRAPADGTNYATFQSYFNNTDNVLGLSVMSMEEQLAGMNYMMTEDGLDIPESLYAQLFHALEDACSRGQITMDYAEGYAHVVEYQTTASVGYTLYRQLFILPGATEVIALLESPEVVMGYTDWNELLRNMMYLNVNGTMIPEEKIPELMELLLQDVKAGAAEAGWKGENEVVYVEWELVENGETTLYRRLSLNKYAENTLDWLKAEGYLD